MLRVLLTTLILTVLRGLFMILDACVSHGG